MRNFLMGASLAVCLSVTPPLTTQASPPSSPIPPAVHRLLHAAAEHTGSAAYADLCAMYAKGSLVIEKKAAQEGYILRGVDGKGGLSIIILIDQL